jgi:mycothiol synthase
MYLKKNVHRAVTALRRLFHITAGATTPQLRMVRSFADSPTLTPAELPSGYKFVPFTPESKGAWVELLNATGELGAWDGARLSKEILDTVLPEGAIIVTCGESLVACAAACRVAANLPFATLMYVAVHPSHRQRGLGRAVTLGALVACRNAGFPGMFLCTDDYRMPAIRTYQSLDFKPAVGPNGRSGDR